jgi:hypothetical protein
VKLNRAAPHLFHRQPQLPVHVIGKEDHETDWYGAACGVGVLNPPENRNRTDWVYWFF